VINWQYDLAINGEIVMNSWGRLHDRVD